MVKNIKNEIEKILEDKPSPANIKEKIERIVKEDDKILEEGISITEEYTPIKPVSFPNEFYVINEEINLPEGEYIVKKDIFVKERGSLIVKPGSALLFDKGTGLICYGNLSAKGKPDKIIVFTANNDSWDNIRIAREYSDDSVLEHCLIEKGTGNGFFPPGDNYQGYNYLLTMGGAIFLNDTDTTIKNCILRKNTSQFGGAINIHNKSPKVISCTFYENTADTQGGAIFYSGPEITMTLRELSVMKNQVKPIIEDNKIIGNQAAIGGGMCIERYLGEIRNNLIKKNTGQLEGGGIYMHTCDLVFENNTIQENESIAKGGGGLKYYNIKVDMMKFGTNKIENNKPDNIYDSTI